MIPTSLRRYFSLNTPFNRTTDYSVNQLDHWLFYVHALLSFAPSSVSTSVVDPKGGFILPNCHHGRRLDLLSLLVEIPLSTQTRTYTTHTPGRPTSVSFMLTCISDLKSSLRLLYQTYLNSYKPSLISYSDLYSSVLNLQLVILVILFIWKSPSHPLLHGYTSCTAVPEK